MPTEPPDYIQPERLRSDTANPVLLFAIGFSDAPKRLQGKVRAVVGSSHDRKRVE